MKQMKPRQTDQCFKMHHGVCLCTKVQPVHIMLRRSSVVQHCTTAFDFYYIWRVFSKYCGKDKEERAKGNGGGGGKHQVRRPLQVNTV